MPGGIRDFSMFRNASTNLERVMMVSTKYILLESSLSLNKISTIFNMGASKSAIHSTKNLEYMEANFRRV